MHESRSDSARTPVRQGRQGRRASCSCGPRSRTSTRARTSGPPRATGGRGRRGRRGVRAAGAQTSERPRRAARQAARRPRRLRSCGGRRCARGVMELGVVLRPLALAPYARDDRATAGSEPTRPAAAAAARARARATAPTSRRARSSAEWVYRNQAWGPLRRLRRDEYSDDFCSVLRAFVPSRRGGARRRAAALARARALSRRQVCYDGGAADLRELSADLPPVPQRARLVHRERRRLVPRPRHGRGGRRRRARRRARRGAARGGARTPPPSGGARGPRARARGRRRRARRRRPPPRPPTATAAATTTTPTGTARCARTRTSRVRRLRPDGQQGDAARAVRVRARARARLSRSLPPRGPRGRS